MAISLDPSTHQLGRDVSLCSPSGDLDAGTCAEFREAAARMCGQARVVFDLSNLSFLDSCGLGALIAAVRRIREHGEVVLLVPPSSIRRLLLAAGLDRIVAIEDRLESALAHFTDRG